MTLHSESNSLELSTNYLPGQSLLRAEENSLLDRVPANSIIVNSSHLGSPQNSFLKSNPSSIPNQNDPRNAQNANHPNAYINPANSIRLLNSEEFFLEVDSIYGKSRESNSNHIHRDLNHDGLEPLPHQSNESYITHEDQHAGIIRIRNLIRQEANPTIKSDDSVILNLEGIVTIFSRPTTPNYSSHSENQKLIVSNTCDHLDANQDNKEIGHGILIPSVTASPIPEQRVEEILSHGPSESGQAGTFTVNDKTFEKKEISKNALGSPKAKFFCGCF